MEPHETASNNQSPPWPLFLGCPVWACDRWADEVYPAKTPRKQWLSWYSRTFNTVEGNSTFYALPARETIQRWADEAADGFQFCLKFPRTISHDQMLQNAGEDTRAFLRTLEPLADAGRLGPTFLQLGPKFGPGRFDVLQKYLSELPGGVNWAVELRHHDWFDQADNENRVNDLLRSLKIDKVLFDSRPLFQSPPDDEIEVASQGRKPKTPLRQTVTCRRPMLRIVGRNNIQLAETFFRAWAPIVAKWIGDGLTPYVFTHAPNDAFAPQLGRLFAKCLQDQFDGQEIDVPRPPPPLRQLSLLD